MLSGLSESILSRRVGSLNCSGFSFGNRVVFGKSFICLSLIKNKFLPPSFQMKRLGDDEGGGAKSEENRQRSATEVQQGWIEPGQGREFGDGKLNKINSL